MFCNFKCFSFIGITSSGVLLVLVTDMQGVVESQTTPKLMCCILLSNSRVLYVLNRLIQVEIFAPVKKLNVHDTLLPHEI